MSCPPLYKYIDRDELAKKIKTFNANTNETCSWIIIDVRDSDFEGGNIIGAKNIPSLKVSEMLDSLVLHTLSNYQQVIFHCHLSQERGPKSAILYSRKRQLCIDQGWLPQQEQEILVLKGGFQEFQEKFKFDKELIENYDQESWKFRD